MEFFELIEKVNRIDNNKEQIKDIVDNIDISTNNFKDWVELIYSDKINLFDMKKLPYLIDELYKSTDKFKFMMCCILIESSCDKLEFITNLEKYPIFLEKYKMFIDTLIYVYQKVDNGIANCMSLILLKSDPKMEYIDENKKSQLSEITKVKLTKILNYLNTQEINPVVFEDLEVIVDMACYLNNDKLDELIDKIDNHFDCDTSDIFIIKYKVIHNMSVNIKKIERIRKEKTKLELLFRILERLNAHVKYLNDVTQEEIAYSKMINWLVYPTELDSLPDTIELLGEFEYNAMRFFAYKFSKKDFSIKGELLGIAGGYPNNSISSFDSGYTFSKFEKVSKNWLEQSKNLADFIGDMYKNKNNI